MRSILFAALLTLPTLAAAQTPRDLARLTWPLGGPTVSAQTHVAEAGAGSATDLVRLTGVTFGPATSSAAPTAQVAGAATATSLANLLAGPSLFTTTPSVSFTQTAGIDAASH
jgi:hypothetical protein